MKPQGLHNFMGSPHPQQGWSLPFPHHLPSPAVTQQQKNISPAAGTFHQQPVKAEFPCIHQGVTVELNRVQQPGQDPNPTAHRDKVSFFFISFIPSPFPILALLKSGFASSPRIIPESKPWIKTRNITAQGQDGAASLISMGLLHYYAKI